MNWVAARRDSAIYHIVVGGRIGGCIPTKCGEGWNGAYSEWREKWAIKEGMRECMNCVRAKR